MTEPAEEPRILSGRYELSHLVARGGMAEVYRAHDKFLDRPVAVKILFPELSVDRSFVERFRREAQAAANLSHPNIVPVFDWGEDGGTYFIVMEFVDGRTLSSILRSAGALHPDRAAEITADVAGALAYAHRRGVVHRDVKPGNVLITEEGVVKVTDFGIARALNTEESLTQTGAVMGTATYFSPEQAEGLGVDARSDIYSLGVVLFEMVTGRPPFLGETPVSVASKHVREHPPVPREINPNIPPDLEAIILKCMAKSPEHRYPTGDDLRVDLLRFREGRAVAATIPPTTIGATQALGAVGRTTATIPQVTPPPPVDEPERSRTGVYAAILALLLVALAVVIIFLGQSLGWWHLGSSKSTFSLPNVYNESLSKAESTLHSKGLNWTVQRDSTSNASTNTVIRTNPAKGATVHKGQTITLITGSGGGGGNTQVSVPNLIGQSVSAASSQLTSMGLTPRTQFSSSCPEVNIVCNTSPVPGTKVPANSTVVLITAPTTTSTTQSAFATVPNVSGDSVGQACSVIGNAGLQCGSQTQESSNSVTSGDVIGTQPSGGSSVSRGTTVNLIVSSGPSNSATVPGVVGDNYGQAKNVLNSNGFVPASDGTCTANNDRVISQDPTAGSSAPSGSTVTLGCLTTSTTTTSTTGLKKVGTGSGRGGTGTGTSGGSGSTGATGASGNSSPAIREERSF